MPLQRVFKILSVCFLATFVLGCGSDDRDFPNFTSFQNADAPVRLEFQTVPQRAAGTPFGTINVAIIDFNGLTVTTDTRPVTISLVNPGGATLAGTTTVNAVNGVASFAGLSVDTPGTYTFQATADGLITDESASFTITSGAPATAVFLQGPPPLPTPPALPVPGVTAQVKGVTFNPPLVVEVRDQFGNLVTDASTVTMVVANDPTGTTTLGGTTQVPVVNGVATFTDLTVETGGGAIVLAAAVGNGLAISDPFLVLGDLYLYTVSNVPAGPSIFNPFAFPIQAINRTQVFPVPGGPAMVGSGVVNPSIYTLMTGLVLSPIDGNLYGAANLAADGSPVLVQMNPEPVGMADPFNLHRPITGVDATATVSGMTLDPNSGTVYAFFRNTTNVGLHTINLDTGAATFIGAPGSANAGFGLAFDVFQNPPVMFTGGGAGVPGLSIIDVTTGAATEIPGTAANLPGPVADMGTAPFDGSFIVLETSGGPAMEFLRSIDRATGNDISQAPLPINVPFGGCFTSYIDETP
jgi:hypothetical protein